MDSSMLTFERKRYAEDPRRHWNTALHCESVMYPQPIPNLQLPSREAHFYWQLYSGNTRHEPLYEISLNLALLRTLRNVTRKKNSLSRIVIPRELVKVKGLDTFSRKRIIDVLENCIENQGKLEIFSMENLSLKRTEGVRFVLSLYNSRKTMKSLHCWCAFERTEGPLLIDNGNFNGSRVYENRVIHKNKWLMAIGRLKALTTLSLNYAYIATPNGDVLIELSRQLRNNLKWLQLLCIESETPVITNPNNGVGGHAIPDTAWKKTLLLAPSLRVQLVFKHEKQRRFLSKFMPIHTVGIYANIDLEDRKPLMIDCTIKTLWFWYPNTLVHLYLHLWHHREILDSHLKKILINLPKLEIFEFRGEVNYLETLEIMCKQVRTRIYLKRLKFQLQEPINRIKDWKHLQKEIKSLLCRFEEDFKDIPVLFDIEYIPFNSKSPESISKKSIYTESSNLFHESVV